MNAYQRLIQDLRELHDMHAHDFKQLVDKAIQTVEHEPKTASAVRRAIRAAMKTAGKFDSYSKQIKELQATFVGEVGEKLFDYVKTLHKRVEKQFENVSGFNNWDWGTPKEESGKWSIRVWLKDSPNLPGDLGGNLLIEIEFKDDSVKVDLKDESKSIFKRSYPSTDAAPGDIGMNCGSMWEEKLTGSVDYGD